MGDQYGPNDRQPCGTDAARTTHLAHGEQCTTCGVPRWPGELQPASEQGEVARRGMA